MRPQLKALLHAIGNRIQTPNLDLLLESGLVTNPKALIDESKRAELLTTLANVTTLLQTLIDSEWRVLHSDSPVAPLVYLAPWHAHAMFPGSFFNTQVSFAAPAGVVPPHLFSKNKGVIKLNDLRQEGMPVWLYEHKNLAYEWFTQQAPHKYDELERLSKGIIALRPKYEAVFGYSARAAANGWLKVQLDLEINSNSNPLYSRSDISENAKRYRQNLRVLSRQLCNDLNQTDSGRPAQVGHQTLVFSTRQVFETIRRTLPYTSQEDNGTLISYGDWRYKHNLPHFLSWPMALAIAPDLAFQSLDCWPAKPLFVEYKDCSIEHILDEVSTRRRTISTRVNKVYGTWRFDKCLSTSENSAELSSIFYAATCIKCGAKHEKVNYRSAANFACVVCNSDKEASVMVRSTRSRQLGKIAWLRLSKEGPTKEYSGYDLILGGPQPENCIGYVHLAHRGLSLRIAKTREHTLDLQRLLQQIAHTTTTFNDQLKRFGMTMQDALAKNVPTTLPEIQKVREVEAQIQDEQNERLANMLSLPEPTAPKNFFDLSDLDEPLASSSAGTTPATQATQTDSDLLAMFDDPEDDLPSESGQYN